jgi:thymidylate synthase
MNNLDKQYTALLQDILENGVTKSDRTGTGTLSVFGRQIRHKMSDGFPLLTTKKMPFKTIVTELLWFLRGDTNIKFLVDNNCHIWDGDAYKNYCEQQSRQLIKGCTYQEFIHKIKTDAEFAKKWGELGPVYGRQWRDWNGKTEVTYPSVRDENGHLKPFYIKTYGIDQIANLINDLKTNPDSRRLMVNAWNVRELDSMTLPPCHYGFQVYTRELSDDERQKWVIDNVDWVRNAEDPKHEANKYLYRGEPKIYGDTVPKRAISLMWNQRSVDTFLGLPFNIASYGLLLEIIAKVVNMVPDELIGNLGDTHLYLNHVEQAKEQIGRKFTEEEIPEHLMQSGMEPYIDAQARYIDSLPNKTREPYPLPTLNINTEFWPTESGECGVGAIDAISVFNNFTNDHFCRCLLESDLQLANYQSHPTIKAPLSN